MLGKFIHIENRAGNPIQAGQFQIVPVSQAVRIQIPRLNGGLIWNRPVSALVTTPDGQEQVLHIRDYTRLAQFAFVGIAVAGSFLFWRASRK